MKKSNCTVRSKSTFAFGSSTERDLSYIGNCPKSLRGIGTSTTNTEILKAYGPREAKDMKKIIRQARSITPKHDNKSSGTKLVFGSSTPRDLSYLNTIPYKHRIYNAEIPRPVIITNPTPSYQNDNKHMKHSILEESLPRNVNESNNKCTKKRENKEKKIELDLKDLKKKIEIQMVGDDEDDEKSLSPYSEPDLSNDHFHYLSIPLPLSNTNSYRNLTDNFFKDFPDREHLEEKAAPLEVLCISQCNHPAYNIHDSPLKEQILLNDKSKLLLNDSQQILFDHNFEECEEKKMSKASDIESLREEIEKIKYGKINE